MSFLPEEGRMSFLPEDRVTVTYTGDDAEELREQGLELTFTGVVKGTSPVGLYMVKADNGSTPFHSDPDPDPYWYLWEQEMTAA